MYKNLKNNTNGELYGQVFLSHPESNFNILVSGELRLTSSEGGGWVSFTQSGSREAIISRLILVQARGCNRGKWAMAGA